MRRRRLCKTHLTTRVAISPRLSPRNRELAELMVVITAPADDSAPDDRAGMGRADGERVRTQRPTTASTCSSFGGSILRQPSPQVSLLSVVTTQKPRSNASWRADVKPSASAGSLVGPPVARPLDAGLPSWIAVAGFAGFPDFAVLPALADWPVLATLAGFGAVADLSGFGGDDVCRGPQRTPTTPFGSRTSSAWRIVMIAPHARKRRDGHAKPRGSRIL